MRLPGGKGEHRGLDPAVAKMKGYRGLKKDSSGK